MAEDARDALRRRVATTMQDAVGLEPNFTRMLAEDAARTLAQHQGRSGPEAASAIERRAALQLQAVEQVQSRSLQQLPPAADKAMRDLQEQYVRLLSNPISEETARRWADADVQDYGRVNDMAHRMNAAVVMVHNGHRDRRYQKRIDEATRNVALEIEALKDAHKASASALNAEAPKELPMSHDSPRETTKQAPQTGSPADSRHEFQFTQEQIRRVAEAFMRDSPLEAIRRHPELAGVYASLAVIGKKVGADLLTPPQRHTVEERVRENVLGSIHRGAMPAVRMREHVDGKSGDRSNEREADR